MSFQTVYLAVIFTITINVEGYNIHLIYVDIHFLKVLLYCTGAPQVDAGRGTGSCRTNAGCPREAPYCSAWGFCQRNRNYGSSDATGEKLVLHCNQIILIF